MVLLHFDKVIVWYSLRRPINVVSICCETGVQFLSRCIRCQLILTAIPVLNLLPLLLSRHYFVSKCLRELAVSLLFLYELRCYDLGAFADRLEVT